MWVLGETRVVQASSKAAADRSVAVSDGVLLGMLGYFCTAISKHEESWNERTISLKFIYLYSNTSQRNMLVAKRQKLWTTKRIPIGT